MRLLFCVFIFLSLTACDGLDLDSIDSDDNSSELEFSSELQNDILFSSLMLDSSDSTTNLDGFILMFKSSSKVDQIELAASSSSSTTVNDQAVIGEYDWTITNQKLQVTYPNSIVCTSTKTVETDLQFTVTATCDNPNNGTRTNDMIAGTLIKPLALPTSKFTNRTIEIDKETGKEEFIFAADGSTFVHNIYKISDTTDDATAEDILDSTSAGTYESSNYTNVIKLNFTADDVESHSYLVLLSGELDDEGRVLELQYSDTTDDIDTLEEIIIYTVDNNKWETHTQYTDIILDN